MLIVRADVDLADLWTYGDWHEAYGIITINGVEIYVNTRTVDIDVYNDMPTERLETLDTLYDLINDKIIIKKGEQNEKN